MASRKAVNPADLSFFVAVAAAESLSAAGRDLGITTAAVSKRIAQMEARIGMPLLTRSTRRMGLTPEGELLVGHAKRILGELDELEELLTSAKEQPSGLLRVNATLGFGRMHVAPIISEYCRLYPRTEVQLQLSADPPPLTDEAFDVCIRFGAPPDSRVVARLLAPNRRLLCASPQYLKERGVPATPSDLARHSCIGIRQGSDAYGVWKLSSGKGAQQRVQTVRVGGSLTTNDGEIAVSWALEGHGIVMRAEWDIARYLQNGQLVQVLPQYSTPDASIYAVYHIRHQLTSRVRCFVELMRRKLSPLAALEKHGLA